MISQTVIWTAIPNGRTANGDLKVVCLISPRLSSDGTPAELTLDLFGGWTNWAQTVAQLPIPVVVGNTTFASTKVSTPDPALWAALFAPKTLVRPFRFADHTNTNIRSYPVFNVADTIKKQYVDTLIASPTTFPLAVDLLDKGIFGDIRVPRTPGAEQELLETLDARFSGAVRALPPGPPDLLWDFLQVKRFHLVRKGVDPVDPAATPEPVDFHQVLSFLMEYPAIQRKLGLVLDLTVPANLPPGNTTVRIGLGAPNRTPVTLATVGPGVFEPRADGELSGGMVNLSGANFGVVAMDVDGAALKARQFADLVHGAWMTNARTKDTPDRYALPALRSAGLAVVRTGRATRQAARFTDAKTKNGQILGGGGELTAETLLRGFRWHIFDKQSGRWYSLCQRTGEYVFLRTGTQLPVGAGEEGVVTAAATQRVDGSPQDFYLAEYLCRWHGESLVAPGPGKSLHYDPQQPPEVPPGNPSAEFPLRATFRPRPGSLPPLRLGRAYRLRGVASYVGGAGLPFVDGDTSTDFSHATAEWTYARLEPITPPVVVMRTRRTAGESVHHLVIRTNFDVTDPTTTVPVERHILPPKTSQRSAEEHGMLDKKSFGLNPDAYQQIVARESGQLTGGIPDPDNGGQPYFDVPVLSFSLEGNTTARLPWLADPLAKGAALYGLPGLPAGSVKRVDFGVPDDWPNLLPFRLRLTEGAGPPVDIVDAGRGLEVRLGKGDVAEIELSSHPLANDLDWLQLWRWFAIEASPPYSASLINLRRGEALNGRNWLLSPAHKLMLVCATRQPLDPLAFGSPVVERDSGRGHATISDTLAISRKSTATVELNAAWTDPVDELTDSGWQPSKQVSRTAALGETVIAKSPGGNSQLLSHRHDFGDTKHHLVAYTAVAKSRFAEYFVERTKKTLPGTTPVLLDARGVSPNSEEVSRLDGATRYRRGRDYDLDYTAGTITRRASGGIPGNVEVDIRFLPPISRSTTRSGVRVRSSARPDAPKPLYAVPTFGWALQRPSQDPTLQGDALSRRLGNGLRVYLDRPWWSSGQGEQLAVVLLPNGSQLTDDLRPYVTAWGMDPVYHSTPMVADLPIQANFPKRTGSPGAVSLPELAGQQVIVAPHAVFANEQRRLWYCDIELAGGTSYFPFVRLALARYQEWSLPGLQLSPVALTDFAQLAPDRWVSLGYVGTSDVRVTVLGTSYLATAGSPARYAMVRATLERRDPKVPGDLGWYSAVEFDLAEGLPAGNGRTSWIGTVHLPVPRGSEPMRIVVREYERFGNNNPASERLVFTDALEIFPN